MGRGAISAAIALLQQEGLVHVSGGRGGTTVRPQGARRIRRGTTVRRGESGYLMPAAQPGDVWTVHGAPTVETRPIPERPQNSGLPRHACPSPADHIPAGDPPYQVATTWIHPDACDALRCGSPHRPRLPDRLRRPAKADLVAGAHPARHPEADEAAARASPPPCPYSDCGRDVSPHWGAGEVTLRDPAEQGGAGAGASVWRQARWLALTGPAKVPNKKKPGAAPGQTTEKIMKTAVLYGTRTRTRLNHHAAQRGCPMSTIRRRRPRYEFTRYPTPRCVITAYRGLEAARRAPPTPRI